MEISADKARAAIQLLSALPQQHRLRRTPLGQSRYLPPFGTYNAGQDQTVLEGCQYDARHSR